METKGKFKKSILSNLKTAFVAQIFSLLVSLFMPLVVAKVISVEQFSYWQLFLFYANYVGLFLFGLNDGIYLREGGKSYKDINKEILGTQFKLSIVFQNIIMLIIIFCTLVFVKNAQNIQVFIRVGIYLVVFNLHGYLGYIMQAVNCTKKYSKSVMIEKAPFCAAILVLVALKVNSYIAYIDIYIVCKIMSLFYLAVECRDLLKAKLCPLKIAFREIKINVFVGINLMIANIANSLILGIGRFMIEKKWDVITFGKVSLSLSLVSFFLMFISQVSMVLFPVLRQVTYTQLLKLYNSIRHILGYLISAVFIFYIPIKVIISWWLPQYELSIYYLIFLLPVCTYDGKMNMICNTFFKVLRKERILLLVNVSSTLLSLVTVFISSIVFHNLNLVLISMTFSVAFRCVVSELILSRFLQVNIIKELVEENILVLIFIISTILFSDFKAFLFQILAYVFFTAINFKNIKKYVSTFITTKF